MVNNCSIIFILDCLDDYDITTIYRLADPRLTDINGLLGKKIQFLFDIMSITLLSFYLIFIEVKGTVYTVKCISYYHYTRYDY